MQTVLHLSYEHFDPVTSRWRLDLLDRKDTRLVKVLTETEEVGFEVIDGNFIKLRHTESIKTRKISAVIDISDCSDQANKIKDESSKISWWQNVYVPITVGLIGLGGILMQPVLNHLVIMYKSSSKLSRPLSFRFSEYYFKEKDNRILFSLVVEEKRPVSRDIDWSESGKWRYIGAVRRKDAEDPASADYEFITGLRELRSDVDIPISVTHDFSRKIKDAGGCYLLSIFGVNIDTIKQIRSPFRAADYGDDAVRLLRSSFGCN